MLGASTVTNTGPTLITGDLGVSPGTAITGFPPGQVIGATHAADAQAALAQADNTAAYLQLKSQACDTTFGVPTDIGGLTLFPGVYCFLDSAGLTGQLTLDAQGQSGAVWVFKIESTLITATNSSVLLVNGAEQCNVFWQVGSSATIQTDTTFVGNILALTSVTLATRATVAGRALAQNGAVTMDSNKVTVSACSVPNVPIPPTVGKAFSPATIDAGGASTLTITVSNPDDTAAVLASPLTDTLPSGVTVVAGSATTTCLGSVTSTATSVTLLTGSTIPAASSCTITVGVTAAAAGSYVNSIAAGALHTNNGDNAVPAVATLTVNTPAPAPPTLAKAFSPATITAGGTSVLTITLSNSSATPAGLTAPLTDTLPSGMTVAPTPNVTNTCGGAVTTTASTVTLTGGTIPANGSCTVTVSVTAPGAGNFVNSLAAGALQTGNGSNAGPAIATLTVTPVPNVAPSVVKTFSPASIVAGGTSTLKITVTNPNAGVATLTSPLVDTLPAGLTVSGPPTSSCATLLVTAAGSTVTITGALPANSSCVVSVPVKAAAAGTFVNTIAMGALQTDKGNNALPTTATLVATPVIPPMGSLSLTKTADRTTYTTVGQVIVYTYIIKNTGSVPLTGPFTVTDDKLGTFTCGTAATLAPGASVTCTKSYTIKASDLGVAALPTGVTANVNTGGWLQGVTSTQDTTITAPGLNGVYPGWCIQDYVPLDLHNQPAKLYSTVGGSLPADVAALPWGKVNYLLNHKIRKAGNSDLQFFKDVQTAVWVLLGEQNPEFGINATAQSMITQAKANPTFVPGPNDVVAVIVYSDGMKVKPGSIQESIIEVKPLQTIVNRATGSGRFGTVVVTSPQVQVTVTQTVNVPNVAPKLSKSFTPDTIKEKEVSTVVLTLTNQNSTAATLTAPLIDVFPSGVTATGGATNTCGGTTTVSTGGLKVTLTGGAIPANGSCKVTVVVTAKTKGSYSNTVAAGALQTNKGNNATAAVATLTVKAKTY